MASAANVPVKSKLPSPRAIPGHLTSFPAREGENLFNLVFPGRAFDHYSLGVGNLIASLDFHVTSRADFTR